ncbi:MAG: hypothetical protein LBF34_05520 [Puniceicoccales bacterium]|jgi:hypothetical protein|nr:hypothetical protein [Puniceicoccales bacterium]
MYISLIRESISWRSRWAADLGGPRQDASESGMIQGKPISKLTRQDIFDYVNTGHKLTPQIVAGLTPEQFASIGAGSVYIPIFSDPRLREVVTPEQMERTFLPLDYMNLCLLNDGQLKSIPPKHLKNLGKRDEEGESLKNI